MNNLKQAKRKTNCPVCFKNPATIHIVYGILPCKECSKRHDTQSKPNIQIEFTSQDIKNQRLEHAKSIIQPYRAGVLSKEYLELYGTKNIKPTASEIKKAKRVWKDTFSDNINLKKTK